MLAYHHVYIKHNKEPLIPQQKPEWEMTCPNEFLEFFTRFRALQIYDLRPTQNKLFHLIGKTKTMSIWRNKPLEHIVVPKPLITPQEQDFIHISSFIYPNYIYIIIYFISFNTIELNGL